MSQLVALAAALVVGGVSYLILAWYAWRRREVAGGRGLAALLIAVFVWSACYALELRAHTVADAELWSGLKFVGIVAVAPAFWSFVVAYSGRSAGLSRRVLALLLVEPVLVLALLALPATRHLVHTYSAAERAARWLPQAPVADPGPLFWPHAIYTYLVLLGATGLLVVRLARIARPYRRPAFAMMVGALLPIVGNAAFNLAPAVTREVDPTPSLFAITAIVLVWGFFRLRLLDLVPVARDVVVEQMVDGVLVLDAYGRVVDANPAGATMLGIRRSDVVGRAAVDLVPGAADLLARHRPGTTTSGDTSLLASGATVTAELAMSLTSLTDAAGAQSGQLLVLRDVTERVVTERRLRELLDEQTRLADILQTSLRPAHLPQVPGLRLAARWVPAGRGARVSGDFYDVHPAAGGAHGFVLGDVSGTGVRAAVVTSMARYTVRTLSAQGHGPRAVLEHLNQALQQGDDSERFCTVVYGRVQPRPVAGPVAADLAGVGSATGGSGEAAARLPVAREPLKTGTRGLRLTVALGGHPPPLLRRRGGGVTAVGSPGTVLGLLPEVEIEEAVVDLEPGDVLLVYTDGVTEARQGRDQFGEERLADVLDAAGGGSVLADRVADQVLSAVTEFTTERDDLAVLVMVAD